MSTLQAPDVRGRIEDDEAALRLMDYPDSNEEIPTLDFTDYLAGKPGGLEQAARDLHEISTTVGFFFLKGHGIPEACVDTIFRESRRFHALPDAQKRKVPRCEHFSFKSGYQEMYEERPNAQVNIINNAKPNMHSKFSVNREGGSGGPTMIREGKQVDPNVWPDNLPGFREGVMDYHRRVEILARSFLPVWAKCLGLPLGYFEPYFTTPHMTLSLLHYPPQKVVGAKQYGIAPHTDNSLMTFLAQSNVPGLAVRMPSGHWKLVENVPGTLLVNTGNLIVRWTNGTYLSTKHRVINTNEVDRYSIPLFFGPSSDAVIECLPTCQGPDRPAQYGPTTYREMRGWYYGE